MHTQKPSHGSGMACITRAFCLFLAGTAAFYVRRFLSPPAADILVAAGIVLFLIGFSIASRGLARHWQEMTARRNHDDRK